ncbi:hypothetical protein E2C01_098546 [Portunus trituberculatus]|uniref:Secreted protein n=1 Tax=Portunus trituberculatus TaxID=210409 RepID=A0A5B7K8P0_PORTR|nr:hypothetical protein [Portunus trituberculatus]
MLRLHNRLILLLLHLVRSSPGAPARDAPLCKLASPSRQPTPHCPPASTLCPSASSYHNVDSLDLCHAHYPLTLAPPTQ